jgi:predicted transcriptional regulator
MPMSQEEQKDFEEIQQQLVEIDSSVRQLQDERNTVINELKSTTERRRGAFEQNFRKNKKPSS